MWKQYPALLLVFCLLLLTGCSTVTTKQQNSIPAQVFKHRYDTPMHCSIQAYDARQTIFNSTFLRFIATLIDSAGPISSTRVRLAVKTWNSIVSRGSERIRYDHQHFVKLSNLSRSNSVSCYGENCMVNRDDLDVLLPWLYKAKQELYIASDAPEISEQQIKSLYNGRDQKLDSVFKAIASDPVGRTLISNIIKRGSHRDCMPTFNYIKSYVIFLFVISPF